MPRGRTPGVTMRCRQQLVRALVNEIIVDIDERRVRSS